MKRLLVYSGIFTIGFLAASLWNFWQVVQPERLTIRLTPKDYRLPAEALTIRTDEGLKLAAWFIPPKDGRRAPVVVLLHGYPAEKADMLPIAAALHPHFATLLMDLRSFGKSEGRLTTLGLRERRDVRRALDFLAGLGYTHVGVFGFSLGGALGIMTAAEDDRIQAVAAYASFSDLKTLGYEVYSRLWMLKYPLVELLVLWGRVFLGGDMTKPSPATAAERLSTPVLLIHSREDEQIPVAHAERLRRALAKNPKAEFYFLDRGRHGQLPPDFDERIIKFFRTHLGVTPESSSGRSQRREGPGQQG